jgi:Leucine-rich repeat (LRR) protein
MSLAIKRTSAATPVGLGDLLLQLPALRQVPEDIVKLALEFMGDVNDPSPNSRAAIGQLWDKNVSYLAQNPTIASYLQAIKEDASGDEKFKALHLEMMTDLDQLMEEESVGLPRVARLDAANRIADPSLYFDLASEFRSSSLEELWPMLRTYLEGSAGLPPENAQADVIQAWLDQADPAIFQHVRELRLSEQYLPVVPEIVNRFTNLSALFLSGNNIRVLEADAFHGLSGLEKLNLSENRISSVQKHAFRGLNSRLRSLDLSINKIATLQDPNAFDQFSELGFFCFSRNPIARAIRKHLDKRFNNRSPQQKIGLIKQLLGKSS